MAKIEIPEEWKERVMAGGAEEIEAEVIIEDAAMEKERFLVAEEGIHAEDREIRGLLEGAAITEDNFTMSYLVNIS